MTSASVRVIDKSSWNGTMWTVVPVLQGFYLPSSSTSSCSCYWALNRSGHIRISSQTICTCYLSTFPISDMGVCDVSTKEFSLAAHQEKHHCEAHHQAMKQLGVSLQMITYCHVSQPATILI